MIAESLAIAGLIVVSSLLAKRFYFSGGRCKSKNRLDGKTAIITGANTGIGYETALDFAKRGATVILACRDLKKAQKAADTIIEQTNNTKIEVEFLDLANLKTVKEFAERMNKRLNRLDLLINNAGVMQCPYWKTAEGFEMQFGVNHLAHFLLTNLLIDLLKKQPSRVVNVSSIAHVYGKMKWDDINCELEKNYSPLRCYNQSKLANVLFAYEFAKRFKDSGITAVSLHPGLVRTELMRHADLNGKADIALGFLAKIFFPVWYIVSKSSKEGAQTTIHCAIDDSVSNHNGSYYADCKPKQPGCEAFNDADAKQLWDLSCELVKL